MDFYTINVTKDGRRKSEDASYKIFPVFNFSSRQDLICKGGEMYAFWNYDRWDTSMHSLISLIDSEMYKTRESILFREPGAEVKIQLMNNHNSNVMKEFSQFCKLFVQSDTQFNQKIMFSEDTPERNDYSTSRLEYTPKPGPTPAFDELFEQLYNPEELDKILWFIGALLTNNMKRIQKFMYLYGAKGTGKGTAIKLFEMLFKDYYANISLARLTSGSEFATSQIRELPLLIDSDSNINKIKDDTVLLKLTSHETISVNVKHKQLYDVTFNGLVITASNYRYQVNNVDSGITRRVVVVHPSNRRIPFEQYSLLVERLKFELPHIAYKAISRFEELGITKYETFVDVDMMEATDHVFAFIRENYKYLGDPCLLKSASELYKIYLEDIGFDTRGYKRKIKEELRRYYKYFDEQTKIGGENLKNVFSGFKYETVFPDGIINTHKTDKTVDELLDELGIKEQPSLLDEIAKDYPAQLANKDNIPSKKWDDNILTLKNINSRDLHYLQLPYTHIVLDLDIKENGKKCLRKNLEKALEFPRTYTELSKSGEGVHLHYIYEGESPEALARLIEEDVEIKVFVGKASLRRKLTKCNNTPIMPISTGLPIKEGGKVLKENSIIRWTEKRLRSGVIANLQKKYHSHTTPSVHFIKQMFDEAEAQGLKYDLRDLRQAVLIFSSSSTNQSQHCIKIANSINYSTIDDDDQMRFQIKSRGIVPEEQLIFFDIEIYPNLFVVVYKKRFNKEKTVLINPKPAEIEKLLNMPLVGFNNRRYDNHILYGALLGLSNLELFRQSQRIINKEHGAFYGNAYELSYADIYEYATIKQSLKKWEIKLGINHMEMDIPWDQPVPDDMIQKVVEYCGNDVDAEEKVFEATIEDYHARLIMSEITKLSVNSKTQDHAAMFLFQGDKDHKKEIKYTDLSTIFPGYKFERGKSEYLGINPSEGGRVYAKCGIWNNVGYFDIISMHPNSAVNLNYFGKYTPRYKELVDARVAIKGGRIEDASKYLGGVLVPYLSGDLKALAHSLKIIINIVYGMTSAKYENAFRTAENIDNIVAKRGSLFMIALQKACESMGYNVVHIKTDSIKIADVTDEAKNFIYEFGKKYEYEFSHETTYSKFALVNETTYIAIVKDTGEYEAVGETFAIPYIKKTLFTKEAIVDKDFAIINEVVKGKIYLGDRFIGRIGEFYASLTGDPAMIKIEGQNDKHVSGTKGFKWRLFNEYKNKQDVDMAYYHMQIEKAYKLLNKVGDPKQITDYIPLSDREKSHPAA